jgi:hypothetical protein
MYVYVLINIGRISVSSPGEDKGCSFAIEIDMQRETTFKKVHINSSRF